MSSSSNAWDVEAYRNEELQARQRLAFADLVPSEVGRLAPKTSLLAPMGGLLDEERHAIEAHLNLRGQTDPMEDESLASRVVSSLSQNSEMNERLQKLANVIKNVNVNYVRCQRPILPPGLQRVSIVENVPFFPSETEFSSRLLHVIKSHQLKLPEQSPTSFPTKAEFDGASYLQNYDSKFLQPLLQQYLGFATEQETEKPEPAPAEQRKRKRSSSRSSSHHVQVEPDTQPVEPPPKREAREDSPETTKMFVDLSSPAKDTDDEEEDEYVQESAASVSTAPVIDRKPRGKKRATSANDEGSNWTAIVKRCSNAILELLSAEEAMQYEIESQGLSANGIDGPNGAANSKTSAMGMLASVARQVRKIANNGKGANLLQVIQDEDESAMTRVLKLCEKTVQSVEFFDSGISNIKIARERLSRTPSKVGRGGSANDLNGDQMDEDDGPKEDEEFDPNIFEEKLKTGLDRPFLGLEACSVITGLVDSSVVDKYAKLAMSEELSVAMLNFIKNILENVLHASIAIFSDGSEHSPDSGIRVSLSLLVDKICEILTTFASLLQRERFSDGVVIQIYSMILQPFFWDLSNMPFSLGVEKLQNMAINVLRSLFANFPAHRIAVLDEIIGSLLKLNDTKSSVQMVTVLLIHLVESCCMKSEMFDLALAVKRSLKSNLSRSNGAPVDAIDSVNEADADKLLSEYLHACRQNMEAANGCANYFLKYLISRSFPSHSGDNKDKASSVSRRKSQAFTTEAEYKAILENIWKDIIVLVGEVEWPGADTVAMVFSRLMSNALDEKKQGDTAVKAVALDWFGELIAKIRKCMKSLDATIQSKPPVFNSGDTTLLVAQLTGTDASFGACQDQLSIVWEVQSSIMGYLGQERENDAGLDVARVFHLSMWSNLLANPGGVKLEECTPAIVRAVKCSVLNHCESFLFDKSWWSVSRFQHFPSQTAFFSNSPPSNEQRKSAQIAWKFLQPRLPLFVAGDAFMSRILTFLDSEVITVRTRALKALSDIVNVDSAILSVAGVRKVVSSRLLDQSKSVRDAAVELVGKFVISDESGTLIDDYFPILIPRILDIGASVRKRIIKLMRDIYLNSVAKVTAASDGKEISPILQERLVDICSKLIGRLSDEEDSDLALKTIYELWLAPFKFSTPQSASVKHPDFSAELTKLSYIRVNSLSLGAREEAYLSLPAASKKEVKTRVSLMVTTVEALTQGGRNAIASDSIGDVLKMVLMSKALKQSQYDVIVVVRSIIECLTDEILVLEEKNDRNYMKDVLALLFQFAKIFPGFLVPHITLLQPYLGSGTSTADANSAAERALKGIEEKIMACAVSILGTVIPHVETPDVQMLSKIEANLIGSLTRRSFAVVPSTDNVQLVRNQILSSTSPKPPQIRNAARCLIIMSLLCRNFNFDEKITSLEGQAKSDLISIAPTGVLRPIFESFCFFASSPVSLELKSMALQSLGNLFVVHPRLMLEEKSRSIMDAVFKGDSIAHKVDLIKVFGDFLRAERRNSVKKESDDEGPAQEEGTVNIKVLIGNAEEMGDAGVSSAVMQMYLEHLLTCALDCDQMLSAVAFDVICIILEQGLVHPILCLPCVVAMQTNQNLSVRDRACSIYDHLAEKHQTFIHSKNIECVRKAFEYQYKLTNNASTPDRLQWVKGLSFQETKNDDEETKEQPVATLGRMYTKIQTRRNRRNEFLSTMVRMFDVDIRTLRAKPSMWTEVCLCRFVAENLASFDYKTLDEVLFVIYTACQVLSVTGETVQKLVEDTKRANYADEGPLPVLANASLIVSMLILVKGYLQRLYNLADKKYIPSENVRSGDRSKQAVRTSNASIDWIKLPFAEVRSMATKNDMIEQCDMFIELISTDYFTLNSDEEAADEEEIVATPSNNLTIVLPLVTDVDMESMSMPTSPV
ncbi:Sister chromatid cohesion protein 2, partial [Blyttiomyces sp. JEL0837]